MFRCLFFRLNGRITAECGHPARRRERVSAFGEWRNLTIIPPAGKNPEYCHRCLEQMAIRCAWCSQPIFIGDPITLYSPSDPNFQLKADCVKHRSDPDQYVGCLRMNCADTGADLSGYWVPPGKVHRIISPIEMCLGERSALLCDNICDMRQASAQLLPFPGKK